MFGSNYLSLMSLTDENPPVKRISLAESDNYYTITVIVCNYVWGDETLYNPKNITYEVKAVLTATDGGENLPGGITDITMSGKKFNADGTCTLTGQKLAAGKAEKKQLFLPDSKSVERQDQNPDNGGTGSQFGRRGQFAETGSNSFVCRLQSDKKLDGKIP